MKKQEQYSDYSFNLSYSLTYEEAYSAFYLICARGNPKARKITSIVTLILALVLIVLYALNPYYLEYFFLPVLLILTYFGLTYYPHAKAKAGAKKVAASNGIYKVELFSTGHIKPFNGEKLPFAGDKQARAFETETLIVLRPDRLNTFCLPKRVMSQKQIEAARSALRESGIKFTEFLFEESVAQSD